jgi:dihydroxyacetone kinase-like predicted kinase
VLLNGRENENRRRRRRRMVIEVNRLQNKDDQIIKLQQFKFCVDYIINTSKHEKIKSSRNGIPQVVVIIILMI